MPENGGGELAVHRGTYLVGDLRIDLWRGEVRRGAEVSSLGGQPLTILSALLESPGLSLSREELQTILWPGESFGDLDQRLNAAVRLLRRGLGDSSEEPRYLETLRGRGYRICANVDSLEPFLGSTQASSNQPPEVTRRPVGRSFRVALIGGLVLIGAVVVASGRFHTAEPESAEPGTSVGAAYREYLSAMRLAGDREIDGAKRHLQAALDLDPDYASAYVLLGRLYRADREPRRAEDAFREAIAREPGFADAHLSLANVLFWNQWDWSAAEESFLTARRLAPARAEVHHSHAWFLLASRRFEEAEASMNEALALEPMSAVLHSDLGWFYYRMRNYPAALRTCHAALDLEPTLRSALDCRHRALARLGSYEEALQTALELADLPEVLAARFESQSGGAGYRALLVHLDQTGAERNRFVRAMNLAAADRAAAALRQLELALEERDSLLVLIDVTPEFDSLVPDERFQTVRRAVQAGAPEFEANRPPALVATAISE